MNFSLSEIPGFRTDFVPAYTNPEVAAGPRRTAAALAPVLEAMAAPAEPREFEPILDPSFTEEGISKMASAAAWVKKKKA